MARVFCLMVLAITLALGAWKGAAFLINSWQFSYDLLTDIKSQVAALSPNHISYSSKVLSSQGEHMAYLPGRRRHFTGIEDIPPLTIKAFLAIEDHNFYHHSGICVRGILRAFLVNLRHGRFVEGGSTITQQTARSFFLSRKKILSRKVKEMMMAMILERRFSKNEILEIYLNQMYFGLGAYGIGAASQIYFDTHPQDLSIGQSAYLAGLLKAPSRLASRPKLAQKRQKIVLGRMLDRKMITDKAYSALITNEVIRSPKKPPRRIAPYFIDSVSYEMKRYLDKKTSTKGWLITSTFDRQWQKKLTQVMERKWKFLFWRAHSPAAFGSEVEIAGVVYDLHNHHILALKGGKSYRLSQFNRAFYTKRAMDKMINPYLGLLLMGKGIPMVGTDGTRGLREGLKTRNLFFLASQMERYGSGSITKLLSYLGHAPLHGGQELLLGYETVSPLILARMITFLMTGKAPPRPTLIRQIQWGGASASADGKIFQESPAPQKKSPLAVGVVKQLFQSSDCTLSYSSITSRRDDYWSVYVSDQAVSVIWLGSERGTIKLPPLTASEQRNYESLGHQLSQNFCVSGSAPKLSL